MDVCLSGHRAITQKRCDMGLSATGKRLVQCGIELLDVKEELLNVSSQEPSAAQQKRLAQLEHRKKAILEEVSSLSEISDPSDQRTRSSDAMAP